ncbi:MAG: DUF1800 family protein, partial [Moraxella sp.]|nr:DUF1800 family protein [Moraxella sp.]
NNNTNATQRYRYPKPTNNAEAARFLQQAQFSSTLVDIRHLRSLAGYEAWIDEQMKLPMDNNGLSWLKQWFQVMKKERLSVNPSEVVDEKNYWWVGGFGCLLTKQFCTEKDMLRKRVALALSEIFVVSYPVYLNGFSYLLYAMESYWHLLNTHAFGNYRNLLEAVTLSSAMGQFLGTLGNRKANGRGSQPDENYAREVLQLFSIGLTQLNMDGTEKKNAQGKSIETYDLAQVSELAKVFTGYVLDGGRTSATSAEEHRKPMKVDERYHETGAKKVFDTTIPSGTPPKEALKMALDAIFNHANVAPFISKLLIQRLVTANPTPAYVGRVSAVFANNGKGVRGDLSAVIKAILLDDEARRPPNLTDVTHGKVREPMISYIQWLQTFSTKKSLSGQWMAYWNEHTRRDMGFAPFTAPSVFNFFSPTYAPINNDFITSNKLAPELQMVDEASIAIYIQDARQLASAGVQRGNVKGGWNVPEIKPDYSYAVTLADKPTELVNYLDLVMCANTMSSVTKKHIITACEAFSASATNYDPKLLELGVEVGDYKMRRVKAAVWMTLISPDYRVQK